MYFFDHFTKITFSMIGLKRFAGQIYPILQRVLLWSGLLIHLW